MRQFKILTIPFLLVCLVSPFALVGQSRSLVSEMSDLAWAEEVDQARDILEARRVDGEQPTPEFLAAVSWLARGASFAERWDLAERYASEAYEGSLELMKERPLDAERFLPTALGAGIEVLGRTYDAQGDRARAVTFLSAVRQQYAGTSIETRIQKELPLGQLGGEAVSCSRG